jgi:hypothetical protein
MLIAIRTYGLPLSKSAFHLVSSGEYGKVFREMHCLPPKVGIPWLFLAVLYPTISSADSRYSQGVFAIRA